MACIRFFLPENLIPILKQSSIFPAKVLLKSSGFLGFGFVFSPGPNSSANLFLFASCLQPDKLMRSFMNVYALFLKGKRTRTFGRVNPWSRCSLTYDCKKYAKLKACLAVNHHQTYPSGFTFSNLSCLATKSLDLKM